MICHDSTRDRAIAKTIRAIDEYTITGLETTLGFCRFVLKHEAFTSGNFDTKFVEKYFKPGLLRAQHDETEELLAALLATLPTEKVTQVVAIESIPVSNWKKNRT
jgi:acetyl-CoA carboxylase, biotin carboxylase subunit